MATNEKLRLFLLVSVVHGLVEKPSPPSKRKAFVVVVVLLLAPFYISQSHAPSGRC